MIVSRLRLSNWGPFRGEHVLELEAKAYAVVARMKADPERSNFLGKSSILEAIYFALSGEHRHRYDDEWVSRGEPNGAVELTLSTGHRFMRTRDRKAGRLYAFAPDNPKGSTQAEAQAEIDRLVGLSPKDFKATCYFEQRQMARFVLQDASKRTETVSGWFKLAPLEACEARAKDGGRSFEAEAQKVAGMVEGIDQRLAEVTEKLRAFSAERGDGPIEKLLLELDERLEKLALAKSAASGKLEVALAARARVDRAEEYARVVSLGKAAKAELEGMDPDGKRAAHARAATAKDEAATARGDVLRDLREKTKAATGCFDGQCPLDGARCPRTAEVNEAGERSKKLVEDLAAKEREARAKLEEAAAAESRAMGEWQAAERLAANLNSLRERARLIKASIPPAGEIPSESAVDAIRDEVRAAYEAITEATVTRDRVASWKQELARLESARALALEKTSEVTKRAARSREAAAIFRAARRRVAERNLEEIEAGANDVLRDLGAALTVKVQWAREGKGLATACEACGHPFPASTKVRSCERCGAARGQKVENKLEVILSDRSGAAEDLVGAAVQLSASRWLRADRGTPWSVALIDEPVGALDASHRKAFSSGLARMLAGSTFRQGIVVAHHASVLDALPGRIEVVSDGGWSSARVVA